jgi:hypothetical protein
MDMENEIAVIQPDIEGEFTVEELSGLNCRTCRKRLMTGATACPRCHRVFCLPTPNLKNVPEGYSPARAKVMAAIHRDRISDAQIEQAYKTRGLTRPPDSDRI